MKKVLATAVLATLIGFGSGCHDDKKKNVDPAPAGPILEAPPVQPYVPSSVTAVPSNTAGMVSPAPMAGPGDATPVVKSPTHTGTHHTTSGTHTAGTTHITGANYTIKSGDTLQKISMAKYGTTKHWKAILKANPQIKDPNKLIVGQKIKLP